VGELTEIIRTTRGYQILKLESRSEVKGRTFEEARSDIGRRVIDGKGRAAMQKYLDELRTQARYQVAQCELKRAYDQALAKRRQQTGAAPAPAA
jgi:parvulin-like peptidyl-prolyl isomerase